MVLAWFYFQIQEHFHQIMVSKNHHRAKNFIEWQFSDGWMRVCEKVEPQSECTRLFYVTNFWNLSHNLWLTNNVFFNKLTKCFQPIQWSSFYPFHFLVFNFFLYFDQLESSFSTNQMEWWIKNLPECPCPRIFLDRSFKIFWIENFFEHSIYSLPDNILNFSRFWPESFP